MAQENLGHRGYRRISKGRGLKYIFFASFVIGIIVSNLLGTEQLEKNGVFNTYFLKQYQYAKIDTFELLRYIVGARLPVAALLFLTGFTRAWYLIQAVFIAGSGAVFGYLFVSGIVNVGIKAVLIVPTTFFPHYLFYVSGYLFFLEILMQFHGGDTIGTNSGRVKKTGKIAGFLAVGGQIFLLLIFGILTESYANPWLMKRILKIV